MILKVVLLPPMELLSAPPILLARARGPLHQEDSRRWHSLRLSKLLLATSSQEIKICSSLELKAMLIRARAAVLRNRDAGQAAAWPQLCRWEQESMRLKLSQPASAGVNKECRKATLPTSLTSRTTNRLKFLATQTLTIKITGASAVHNN